MDTQRYQIYMHPAAISAVDGLATEIGTTRSHIIRDVVDRIMVTYSKVILKPKTIPLKDNPLIQMGGAAVSPTGHLSENIDEIYQSI